MKLTHQLKLALVVASVGLATAGSASAQITRFYSDAGSGSNAAAGGLVSFGGTDSIGYDSLFINSANGNAFSDTGTISTRPQVNAGLPAYYMNFSAGTLPASVSGQSLQSVTMFLYAEGINPDNQTLGFTIFDGLGGTGGTTTLPLSSANEGGFFSFTLSAAQFANGFSIGATGLGSQAAMNVSSEENLAAFQRPGLLATYAPIPEPSAALLGAFGALGLLRRRRA